MPQTFNGIAQVKHGLNKLVQQHVAQFGPRQLFHQAQLSDTDSLVVQTRCWKNSDCLSLSHPNHGTDRPASFNIDIRWFNACINEHGMLLFPG